MRFAGREARGAVCDSGPSGRSMIGWCWSRVVISGIGVVSPYGVGRERFWSHVSRGCSRDTGHHGLRRLGVSVHGRRPRSLHHHHRRCAAARGACALRAEWGFQGSPRGAKAGGLCKTKQGPSRSTPLFARVADRGHRRGRGVERRGAAAERARRGRAGRAAAPAASTVAERQYFEFFNDGWKRVTPYAIPVSIVGMISSEISIALELHGISHVLSTGCTSSTDAIGYDRVADSCGSGRRDPVGRARTPASRPG